MRISEAQETVWKIKLTKGFNTTDPNLEFCLLYGEVAEAVDALRKHPEHLGHELADVLLYTASLAQMHGIDLEKAVAEKLEINAARVYRPGPNGVLVKDTEATP
jgi:NTP pyrophosphatase (non-canonical NTP hydrolase)